MLYFLFAAEQEIFAVNVKNKLILLGVLMDYLQNDNYLYSEDDDYQEKLIEKLKKNDEESIKIDVDFNY